MTKHQAHLVLVTTDFKPKSGGVAEYLHGLWDQVVRMRPVTVVATVPRGTHLWDHAYPLEELPLPPARHLGERIGDRVPLLRKAHTAAYFARLRRFARRTVVSIRTRWWLDVHVFVGIWDTESHFWCQAFRRAGVPYSLHAHGLEIVRPFYGRHPEWRRADFCGARTVVANSRGTAELVRAHLGAGVRTCVVHPGVSAPCDFAVARRRAEELRCRLAIGDGPVVLSVARLVKRKGIDLAVRSVARLRQTHRGLQYVVAGEGLERRRLEALAEEQGVADRVHFLGLVDEPTKWALYELGDVFVMPNRTLGGTDWEGFGIAFVEAALAGKPSIGGNNGGVADAVVHGSTGLLVDPEQQEDLDAALDRLLRERELRRKMGEAARERARVLFDPARVAAAFLDSLDQEL